MPKSTTKSTMKKIKGPFETYNLFEKMELEDHCWSDKSGVKVSGPGVFCWIYIFYVIIINIMSLLAINDYKKLGLTDGQIMIRYFFQFLFMFLSVTFMYSMCKRCRGLEGFLILVLLSFVSSIIALGPFMNKITTEMNKTVEGQQCGADKKEKVTEGFCSDCGMNH